MHTHRAPSFTYVAGFVWWIALACCASTSRGPDIGRLPLLTSDDPAAEAELREAQALAERGQRAKAKERYRAFLHKRPDDRLVSLAQLGLGRILLDQHDDGEALALFASVAEHPEPSVAEQGRFYGGVATERLGRHSEAIEALEPMVGRTIEPADTLLLLRTLVAAYAAENKYVQAITTLAMLLNEQQLSAGDRAAARKQLAELIDRKASPADIRDLLDDLDAKNPAFRPVLVRALRDADAAHDLDRARELLERLKEEQIPLDAELSAIAMRSQSTSDANPNAVGAILSLSGRARKVGELALRGLMQAANLPPSGPAPANAPSVIFRDDAGDANRAIAAVEELANVHRVIAIIGPMDAQMALAAGRRAQELDVPLIALSPAGAIPGIGNMVFRYFPTPDAEASALVRAAKARGVESVAVLYPDHAYGEAMLAAFRRAADGAGVNVTLLRSYLPGATSFGAEADALAKGRFDAVFVPDSAQELALIAPALAAAGLWCLPAGQKPTNGGRAISVLAPSVAFDASLPRLAGRYLQGALFSVPFDSSAPGGPSHDFVLRFNEAFGTTPDAFAAFAHDAYRLVRASVEAGAMSRAELAKALMRTQPDGLVAPAHGFAASREARDPVQVMTLEGSEFGPLGAH